jgi:hypothetical protein
MTVFILLSIVFIMMMVLVCLLLASGLRNDTITYDMNYLWDQYPADVRAEIRKTFE